MFDHDALAAEARSARKNSYAPYSGYSVGSVVVDEIGRHHVGVNVENVAYGSTICAERSAILRMVSDGGHRIAAICVSTKDGGTPCGACLQVIAEFAEATTPVVLASDQDEPRVMNLSDLFPHGFASAAVHRTLGS